MPSARAQEFEPNIRCGIFFVENMSHLTFRQTVRSVAGVAVPSNLSTTRARFKQTQIQQQLCTTSRFCTVWIALARIPLRRMLTCEVALLRGLQRNPITAASQSDRWHLDICKAKTCRTVMPTDGRKIEKFLVCRLQEGFSLTQIEFLLLKLA